MKEKKKSESTELNVKPFMDRILTTTLRRKVSNSGIILTKDEKGLILTKQQVVAAGDNAGVKVGDWVEVDVNKFPKKRIKAKHDIGPDSFEVIPPLEEIDGNVYLFLTTRELKWVYG